MKTFTSAILVVAITAIVVTQASTDRAAEQKLQQAIDLIESKGDLAKATPLFEETAKSADRGLAARGLLYLAQAQERYGKADALTTYQRIITTFGGPEESAATGAVAAAARTAVAAMAQKDSTAIARPLWDQGAGVDSQTISPDGRYVSFSTGDSQDLAVRDVASGRERRLTNCTTANDCMADVTLPSPDSRFIAYGWNTNDNIRELRVIDRDGGQPRVVYPNSESEVYIYPSGWTPDGKSILVRVDKDKDRTHDLLWVPASGGPARFIKHFEDVGANGFILSPDGRTVAYTRPTTRGRPERDLFSMSVDTGREVQILEHAADDDLLAWFPSSDRLLFTSDRSGTYGIWAVRIADGRAQGEPVLLRPDTGHVHSVGFTKKGDFYYSVDGRRSEASIGALDPTTGKQTGSLMRVDGRYTDGITAVAWSPTGDRIAYLQATTSAAALENPTAQGPALKKKLAIQTISKGSAGDLVLLDLAIENIGDPAWLPDGRVVVQGTTPASTRRPGLLAVNIESGAVAPITTWQPNAQAPNQNQPRSRPALSADGRRLFLRRGTLPGEERRTTEIVVRDLDPASTEQVLIKANFIVDYVVSPDGRWIAMTRNTTNMAVGGLRLSVVPASGGEARALSGGVGDWSIEGALAWSQDGRFLYVVKSDAGAPSELWQVFPDGSAPRNTGIKWPDGIRVTRVSVNPDGRRLAFSTQSVSSKTWVLQNLPK